MVDGIPVTGVPRLLLDLAAFERDRLRQEDLLLHGIGMTRVTDVRFARDPDAVLARVRRLLEGR